MSQNQMIAGADLGKLSEAAELRKAEERVEKISEIVFDAMKREGMTIQQMGNMVNKILPAVFSQKLDAFLSKQDPSVIV